MSRDHLTLGWGRRTAGAAFAASTVGIVLHQTTRIFTADYRVWPLLLAAAATTIVALLMSSAPAAGRVLALAVMSIAGAATAIVAADGAFPDDLIRAPLRGISDVVGTVWPSPPLAAGAGAISLIGCLCAGAAVDLAVRRNPGTALLPSLALIGLVAMLSAPGGPPPAWSVAAYVVAALGVLGSRTFAYRSTITSLFAAVVVVTALSIPVVLAGQLEAERYDPRLEIVPPVEPRSGISPLARLDEWRSLTPARQLFATTLPTPARWRLVGLTRYDGRTWLPAADYRRAGSVLAQPDPALATTTIGVEIGELDAAWLPTFDRTLSVSQTTLIDGGRSGLLAATEPVAGTTYELRLQPLSVNPAQLAAARITAADSPFIDGFELSPQLRELATSITVGARTDLQRAEMIASYLRDEFVLDIDSPPGHSIAVLELFVDRSRRGRDEQFVATYGLLAAAVGLPVRIAVGFESVAAPGGAGTIALSDRAIAWPEVEFESFGWMPFDPVPSQVNDGSPALGEGAIAPTEDPTEQRPPTTAVTSTQTTLPDTSDNDTAVADPTDRVPNAAVGVVVVAAGLVIGATAYVTFIVWLKARKRRRRRVAADPRDRAVGAFISSIEVLIDLGGSAPRAATNAELVARGAATVGESASILVPVADIATEAVYAPEPPATGRADEAWVSAELFETETNDRIGRYRRLRAKASTRSLRRGWR